MHVAYVTENVPNPATGGGALTAWSTIGYLLGKKHQVTAICLVSPDVRRRPEEHEGRVEALRHLGPDVVEIDLPARPGIPRSVRRLARRATKPRVEDLFPGLDLGPAVERAICRSGADAVLAYHWTAIAACRSARLPKVATAGDPPTFVDRARTETDGFRHAARLREAARLAVREAAEGPLYAPLLRGFDAVGLFAAHHAAWMRARGVPRCRYLHTPLPDPLGEGWRKARNERAPGPPRLLHIGHLQGTATLRGLDLLARDVLPLLERELGEDGFVFDLVGGHEPPPALGARLRRPSVRLRGHVEPANRAFLEADALVVPTPIRLGIRVRIVTGWSFATPVVAHEANAAGIPELRHGENALLGRSGPEVAEQVLAVLRDPALCSRVGAGGRATFEQHFDRDVACRAQEEDLERALGARKA